MKNNNSLFEIIKNISRVFKNTKIEMVDNEDIINFFKNKENAELIQKKFFFKIDEKEND